MWNRVSWCQKFTLHWTVILTSSKSAHYKNEALRATNSLLFEVSVRIYESLTPIQLTLGQALGQMRKVRPEQTPNLTTYVFNSSRTIDDTRRLSIKFGPRRRQAERDSSIGHDLQPDLALAEVAERLQRVRFDC